LPTWEGFAYLATVIDWAHQGLHRLRDLAITCAPSWSSTPPRMAARNHTLADGAIFHSDRGTQYTCGAFAAATAELHIRRSVGRTGTCFDNALAESFNASPKVERVNPHRLPDA
jgi:putative transposase